jgi:hypothetical protein
MDKSDPRDRRLTMIEVEDLIVSAIEKTPAALAPGFRGDPVWKEIGKALDELRRRDAARKEQEKDPRHRPGRRGPRA